MTLLHEFKREEKLPSYFVNRIQDFLSAARTDLRLEVSGTTKVKVVPSEPYGLAAVNLQGRWRFSTEAVERTHPGGAVDTYSIWAVGTDQDISEAPNPFTDNTDYGFELRITDGSDPSGEGVEVFEKIGEVDWSGSAITALRQTYNAVTGAMLADSALSSATGSDLSWTREAGGALQASIKDGVVNSRNALLAAGVVSPSSILVMGSEWAPTSGGKLEITPDVKSILIASFTANIELQDAKSASAIGLAGVGLDGAPPSPYAYLGIGDGAGKALESVLQVELTVSQDYAFSLSAAPHVLQIEGRRLAGDLAELSGSRTRFTYLLLAAP